MSIKSSNQLQQQLPNKYRYIKGYLNSDNPIPPRALLKETCELIELPPNAVLLNPAKINNGELLTKAVKFYDEGQTFNVIAKDIKDCFNVLLMNEDDSKLIIGAVTFAPFVVEDELLVYIILLKVKKNEQRKGNGAALFDIMKKFTSKCQLFTEYSKVQLLLSASTALKPHGFFLKQGCEFVVDNDLLELTQKDSTLMQLKFVDQKSGDQSQNERVIDLQKNNQNTIATAIADTIQHYGASLTTIKDQNEGGDGHEGRVSRVEETKQAINGQNRRQADHLFDNIPNITPNDSNCNRNEVQEFKLPLNKRNLKVLDKQQKAVSDIGSKVSMASNKTSGGNIKRHCELCGFKHIADWVKHKKNVHGGIEVPSLKCLPQCSHCTGKFNNHGLENTDLVTNHGLGYKSRTWLQITDLVSNHGLANHGLGIESRTCKSRTWYRITDLQITDLVSNHGLGIESRTCKSRTWYRITDLVSNHGLANHGLGIESRTWYRITDLQITDLVSNHGLGDQPTVQQQQYNQSQHPRGTNRHEQYKEYECQTCKKVKQSRYFPKNSSICNVCDKKQKATKSAINVPLNNDHMMDFNDDDDGVNDQQVDPDDSISMVGNKRLAQKPLDFKEIEYQAEVIDRDDLQEQVSSPIATRQVQDTQTYSAMDMSIINTDMAVTSLLDALQAIDTSLDTDFEVSLKVSAICQQFVHQQSLALLKKDSYPRLASLITKILKEQAGELKQQQLAGLFVAACKLQGLCWGAAVIMLQKRKSEIQQYVLQIFSSHIEVVYGTDIAQWISDHWMNVQEQQLDIMKQLKGVQSPVDILFFSLVVQVDSVPKFIEYSSYMLQRDVSIYMLDSVRKRLTQQRLSVHQFLGLCELVQLDNIKSIIQSNADIFKSTPLQQWTTKIDELKATSHLINTGSVVEAIEEFVKVGGSVEPLFADDLFHDSFLGLGVHQCRNKPNAKQLGMAQYCVGTLRRCQRQLLCVPSGQGKSRIIISSAVTAVKTGIVGQVHIVYENQHLLDRDRTDFVDLLLLLGCEDKIFYHVGCDFPTQEGDLIIVDESDTVMFESPENFANLINGRACICFTATPDNCDAKGAEANVVSALHFKVFHYSGAEIEDANTRLKMDQIQSATTIKDRVSFIASLVTSGPVLVYGSAELKEALAAVIKDFVTVDPQVDYSMLRKLDQAPYKVLFSETQFGMRGVDYRCENVPMHLVIEQSFDCIREAMQGVARVGRFGDTCKRIIFDGVKLIDETTQLKYTAKLMKYVEMLMKIPNAKPIKLKTATATQQRNTGGSNLSKKQVQAAQQIIELQLQKKQQQQKTITDFITTNKNK